MRVAGRLAAQVLAMIRPHVVEGVTTGELDRLCHDYIVNTLNAIPAPLNYRGFPKSICTSVNHVVCHGIPGEKRLKDGDIINIDVTVIKEGYHGDTSKMFFVGTPPCAPNGWSRCVTNACILGSQPSGRVLGSGTWGPRFSGTRKRMVFPSCANTAGMGSVGNFTKSLRYCTTGAGTPGCGWRRV